MKKVSLVIAIIACLVAGNASATSVHVDFTDKIWSAADGHKKYYVPYADLGITVLVRAWEHYDLSLGNDGRITWNNGDGLGIAGNDEIEKTEYLKIMFVEGLYEYGDTSNPLPLISDEEDMYTLQLDSIELLDLFQDEGPAGEDEVAIIRGQGINLALSNPADDPMGYYQYSFDSPTFTSHLRFYGSNQKYGEEYDGFSDYAVAGLWLSSMSVPEPTSMLIFGAGLAGLAGVGRRRKK